MARPRKLDGGLFALVLAGKAAGETFSGACEAVARSEWTADTSTSVEALAARLRRNRYLLAHWMALPSDAVVESGVGAFVEGLHIRIRTGRVTAGTAPVPPLPPVPLAMAQVFSEEYGVPLDAVVRLVVRARSWRKRPRGS